MPLTFIGVGRRCRIKCVTGDDSVRKHLGSLGFATGVEVEIVSEMDGNLIIGRQGSGEKDPRLRYHFKGDSK